MTQFGILKNLKLVTVVFMIGLFSVLVLSCGGGGGSGDTTSPPLSRSFVSGVAAAGAPIIGAAYLQDSAGTILGPQEIDIDGSFAFDVTDLIAPFCLLADGAVGGNGYRFYQSELLCRNR